jgi:O-antigen ligase
MVETGIIGLIIAVLMLQQMLATAYRLFRHATDPLYRGLGLGLLLASSACIVANCFGDRWTYLEITAPLWVLVAAAIRAGELGETEGIREQANVGSTRTIGAHLAYR